MQGENAISLRNIHINDKYWNRYTKLIEESVLPYQWMAGIILRSLKEIRF